MLSTEPRYPPFLLVGAQNVAGELGLDHAFVDKEKLLEWDPDVIFIDEGGLSLAVEDLDDPSYASLGALEEGQVYGLLPYNWYTSNFGTVFADAYYIGGLLYPDLFEDVDPVEMADEIFERLLGEPVYDDMEAMYGGFEKLDL